MLVPDVLAGTKTNPELGVRPLSVQKAGQLVSRRRAFGHRDVIFLGATGHPHRQLHRGDCGTPTLMLASLGGQENVLELTFNHDGRAYDLGTGYGHIAIGVDDLDETLSQLKEQGIEPEREPYRVREGGSRICFVRDPDGWFRT